jgi:hypothetical protein
VYLFPAALLSVALAVTALGLRARQRNGYGPLALGLTAAVVVLVSKFAFQMTLATYAGAGLLIIASLWNSMPRRAVAFVPFSQCAPVENGQHKRT